MHSPLTVGQSAAIAGRSISPSGRKINFDMAISAPVLPPETAAAASPDFTASIAIHMLEPLPRRSAALGFSSEAIARSVWTARARAASAGCLASSGSMRAVSPNSRKLRFGWRFSEIAAPGTTTSGPKSPPMASSAMVRLTVMGALRSVAVSGVRSIG